MIYRQAHRGEPVSLILCIGGLRLLPGERKISLNKKQHGERTPCRGDMYILVCTYSEIIKE